MVKRLFFIFAVAIALLVIKTDLADAQTVCSPTPANGAPQLNIWPISQSGADCTDYPLLSVKNASQNSGYVAGGNVNASVGERLRVRLYVHNGVLDLDQNEAFDVQVRADVPNSIGGGTITAAAWAQNHSQIDSGSFGGNVDVNLASDEYLEYVPGSAQVFGRGPNLLGSFSDAVVSGGASLGDMRGCYQYLRFVTFEVEVKQNQILPQPQTGNIQVNSNIPTSWVLSGPDNFSGSGTSAFYSNAKISPPDYFINVPTISGYNAPTISPSLNQSLNPNQTITFNIFYDPIIGGGGGGNQDVVCTPGFQSIQIGNSVSFRATSGDGSYSWSAPGSSNQNGNGANFSTTYSSAGNYTTTVTSNGKSSDCRVNVTTKPVTSTVSCSPNNQSVKAGSQVSFTAQNGNGSYLWSAPSGSPATGSGSSFFTNYSSPGNYVVTVTSNGSSSTCGVDVTPAVIVSCIEDANNIVLQQIPQTVTAGDVYQFSIQLKNSGTSWWYHGSYYQFVQNSSLNINPTYGHISPSVFPTQTQDENFTLFAPQTPGNYTLKMQMVHRAGADYLLPNGQKCANAPLNDVYFGNEVVIPFIVVPRALGCFVKENIPFSDPRISVQDSARSTFNPDINLSVFKQNNGFNAGLKNNINYMHGTSRGIKMYPPAGSRITAINFDYAKNFDYSLFYYGMDAKDYQGSQIWGDVWSQQTYGFGSGQASQTFNHLPGAGAEWVQLLMVVRSGWFYSLPDNQWFVSAQNIRLEIERPCDPLVELIPDKTMLNPGDTVNFTWKVQDAVPGTAKVTPVVGAVAQTGNGSGTFSDNPTQAATVYELSALRLDNNQLMSVQVVVTVGGITGGNGTLIVSCNNPPGGAWTIVGLGHRTGPISMDSLAPGNYTIVFDPFPGFTTPSQQNATIIANATTSIRCNYGVVGGAQTLNPPTITGIDNSACAILVITWQDNSTIESGYSVWRSTTRTSGFVQISPILSPNTTTFTDTPTPGLGYFYIVRVHRTNPTEHAESQVFGPVVSRLCIANLDNSSKTLVSVTSHSTNQTKPYTSDLIINSGDTLTFRVKIVNDGASLASITRITDSPSGNIFNLRNVRVNKGSGYSTVSNNGNTINISGNKAVGNPNWLVDFDMTIQSTTGDSMEKLQNCATIFYTDGSGNKSVTKCFGPILFKKPGKHAPQFFEVAP